MHVRFWGTRGSLPKPGPDTLRFGGNTSCIEVRTSSDTLVIIDCGYRIARIGVGALNSPQTRVSHPH
jgi:phosphoribosyl 1,2-cyclic phosphodiesterase